MKLQQLLLVLLALIGFFNLCETSPIVERALCLELPITDKIVLQEALGVRMQADKKVDEANYDEALRIVLEGLEQFPTNFVLQADLASLLGDHSENFTGQIKDSMVKRSKELFVKLMDEVEGQPKGAAYSFKNEYCYRFALYKEQYELGLKRVADYWETEEWNVRGFRGYYSQGVGAANYARELLIQGKNQEAIDYAHKAVVAWAQFLSYENTYYNAYVHYAIALGILGHKDEMMKALTRSAELIHRDLNYVEFKEVIAFIDGIEKKNIAEIVNS